MKPEVARRCLEAGAAIINDVAGFRDPAMIAVAAAEQGRRRRHAHAGHAADHADEPALRRCGSRGRRVLRGAAEGSGRSRYSPARRSASTPASALARRWSTTWILLANLGAFRGSAGRCASAFRGRGSSDVCRPAAERADGGFAGGGVLRRGGGQAHVLRVHDVAATRDAAVLLEPSTAHRR